ncbi:chemotaxis protein CheW [Dethiosulfovibrio salsuginis]|uniref:CheW protein n=1 Tax=Dethiosulfovibrio salsuginis TaxID=561720 RepID=A0A1X7K3K0_9BACT|nr:chemotaxis protein CheW [Dethiosulfovibrio salsuginis]SMG35304.1 CheW protein [Dethiosulfovibrio salsuginis]
MKKDVSTVLEERAEALASGRAQNSLDKGDEFVTFRLGQELYGISSELVGEVFPAREITPLPAVPDFIVGVVNLRGKIVSVNDLKAILDLPKSSAPDRFILVLRSPSMEIGLLVEPPVDVMTAPSHSLGPPLPSSSGIEDYISGIHEDVVILKGDRILSDRRLIVNREL